jgi:hypothetical protein
MPFDVRQTVISQYANSPILTALLDSLAQAFDVSALFDAWYRDVWNIDTAVGWGLDVWGRIVGVRRVLKIPSTDTFLRFEETGDPDSLGNAPFETGGSSSSNYALSDDAYRKLILAKAALNITDASIPSINRILTALFPTYGNCYVRDDGGMALTYVFGATLTPVDFAIVTQSGVLPKPLGVTASAESP